MRERLYRMLSGEEMELRERIFRLILVIGFFVSVVAILAGFFLQNALINAIPLLGLVTGFGIGAFVTFHYHKLELAAMIIAVVIIGIIFPLMFFISGGIRGGATVWFVLGILYIFLIFDGRKLAFFLTFAVAADVATYLVAYHRPDWIYPLLSPKEVYYDSLFAVLTVSLAVGIVLRFQMREYEKERKLTVEQKEKIERISRSKDIFFTNMSHEIRTPLNTIIGLNEMILREDISDEVAQDAQSIRNASRLLLALVNDVLDFSKLENNRMELVPVQYQTKELLQDVVDFILIRVREKELELFVDIDSSLPGTLYGDERRIKQILINILTNAVKYTEKGSVTLSVRGEIEKENRVRLTIAVSDTGIGIRKEDLETLYESFRRVDMQKNRNVEGSGLGLTITKQLLNLMGGTIHVDSIYTSGSTFTVTLGQQIIDAQPIGHMDYLAHIRKVERSHYRQSFEAPEARILVVDDSEANLLVTTKLLRATKVALDTAKSGRECLACTQKKKYHVILLDCMMPQMDGLETLHEIRCQESGMCRQTPVIAVTGNVDGRARKQYMDAGFDGYLTKPIDGGLLEAEILKFLPDDILEYRLSMQEQRRVEGGAMFIRTRKRKKLLITTDCVSDLPKELAEKYEIRQIYMYIRTDRGCFQDSKEIDSDNLSRYLSDSRTAAHAVSAPVEEYQRFYAQALKEAEEVIHISLADHAGSGYSNAVAAASGFDHVHVVDSGLISGGEGFLVLMAANMLRGGAGTAQILSELEAVKHRIEMGILLPSVQIFYENGFTGRTVSRIFACMGLHPLIRMRQSAFRISGMFHGRQETARKRFIRRSMRRKGHIDKRVLYITHAGCTVKEQEKIVREVKKYVSFERIIVQKVCVANACSAGLGSISLAYLTTGRNGRHYEWSDGEL